MAAKLLTVDIHMMIVDCKCKWSGGKGEKMTTADKQEEDARESFQCHQYQEYPAESNDEYHDAESDSEKDRSDSYKNKKEAEAKNNVEEDEDEEEPESEIERWNRLRTQVERMKILVEKYPKFANRAGSGQIITQLDAMFSAVTSCENPTPVDLVKVEEQLEVFKGTLLQGMEQDLVKWRRQVQFSTHKIMFKVSIVLLFLLGVFILWLVLNSILDYFPFLYPFSPF